MESGVRLRVERIPLFAATVDTVTCDLTRDPRSEDYRAEEWEEDEASSFVRPPSTSIIRALK